MYFLSLGVKELLVQAIAGAGGEKFGGDLFSGSREGTRAMHQQTNKQISKGRRSLLAAVLVVATLEGHKVLRPLERLRGD